MKERGEERYKLWYERHKIVEKQRQWRIKLEKEPINALDESERGELPKTWGYLEAYWHPIGCECMSCLGPVAQALKDERMSQRPIPPAVRSATSPLPELPGQLQRHLLGVVARALSTQYRHSS